METIKQAKAPHASNRALPMVTSIPKETGAVSGPRKRSLTDCAFLTMTVQMAAPIRSIKLPTIAKSTDTRNPKVCFRIPL